MDHIVQDSRESQAPSRKSSLNIQTNRHTSRSLDDVPALDSTFEATSINPSQSQRTFLFLPLVTLLRAHVPISWLSSHPDPGQPSPGTLLRANISSVSRWDYHVLVARPATSGDLYVFERVETNIFICYPLQGWVKPQWVELAAVGAAPPVELDLLLKSRNRSDHFRKPSISSIVDYGSHASTPASPQIPKNRRGHFARKSILEDREKLDDTQHLNGTPNEGDDIGKACPRTEVLQSHQRSHGGEVGSVDSGLCARNTVEPTLEQETLSVMTEKHITAQDAAPVDPLSSEHLRRQYLETLYVSKTSLAFYAKGPLSRARARARVPNASRSPEQLAEFYRESILPRKKLDTKYKESIYTQIQKLVGHEDVDNGSGLPSQQPRRSRRIRLGKDALWPIENEYITRWWKGRDMSRATTQTDDVHQAIAAIRLREIELQIIIILETLALESRNVAMQQPATVMAESDIKLESTEQTDQESLSARLITKKKRDLRLELDFLADRMCILHSIGLGDSVGGQGSGNVTASSSEKAKNRLQDFCKDIVVPFYGGKLPVVCQGICNKMGGPEVMPRKHKDAHERHVSAKMAVGEATSAKRSFERIFGDDQGQRHFSPPSFARSSTLPTPATLKREPSERPISRSGLQKSASFSSREVDLVADARATALKRRKLDLVAAQKRELDVAIENLKRPNRSTIARSFMDDVEQRVVTRKPAAKKVEPIQISATPRRGMAKYIQVDDYDLPPMTMAKNSEERAFVPSSTVKARELKHNLSMSRSSAQKKAVLSAIHDTPSKSTPNTSRLHVSRDRDELDRAASSALVTSTPTTTRLRLDLDSATYTTPMHMSKSQKRVLLTPLERSEASIEEAFKDITEIPERAGKMMDRVMGAKVSAADVSIYECLGWDDDDL